MKKTAISILIAFCLGASLSAWTIWKLKEKFSIGTEEEKVTAFQVGVYKSLDNANSTKDQYPGAIVLKDGEYYRVFVGVAASSNCEEALESYFLAKNVNVYPKELKVTTSYYQELSKYETLFLASDSSVYDRLNGEMLKKLEGEIL